MKDAAGTKLESTIRKHQETLRAITQEFMEQQVGVQLTTFALRDFYAQLERAHDLMFSALRMDFGSPSVCDMGCECPAPATPNKVEAKKGGE